MGAEAIAKQARAPAPVATPPAAPPRRRRGCMFVLKVFAVLAVAAAVAAPVFLDGYTVAVKMNEFFESYCGANETILDTHAIEWAAYLRGNYTVIRDEFYAFEKSHGIAPRLRDLSAEQAYLDTQTEGNEWRTLFLRLYGADSKHIAHFPQTQRLLAAVPGLYTIMVSVIEPGYAGARHHGVYKGIYRYLLGLEVPDPQACPLTVEGVPHLYAAGEDFMFDDTVWHGVVNFATVRRVSLLLDVRRDFRALLPNLVNRVVLAAIGLNPTVTEIVDRTDRALSAAE